MMENNPASVVVEEQMDKPHVALHNGDPSPPKEQEKEDLVSRKALHNGETHGHPVTAKRKSPNDDSESAISSLQDLTVKDASLSLKSSPDHEKDINKDDVVTSKDGTPEEKAPLLPAPPVEPAAGDKKTTDPKSPGFIFGQNLGDRIANAPSSASAFPTFGSLASGASSSSGFGMMTAGVKPFGFGAAASKPFTAEKKDTEKKPDDKDDKSEEADKTNNDKADTIRNNGESTQKQLEKTASVEYEAKHTKLVLQEVDLVTGEEGERNVFEVNAKLYGHDKESHQWKERGRTNIRLNDAHDSSYSRLVIRMAGTGRIIVNTKLWKEMTVKRSSDKNVSFSAFDTDENTPKVFLISCSFADAEMFVHELGTRIEQQKSHQCAPTSSTKMNGKTEHDDACSPSANASNGEPDSQPAKKPKLYDEPKE